MLDQIFPENMFETYKKTHTHLLQSFSKGGRRIRSKFDRVKKNILLLLRAEIYP